ncbi:ABC transporter substrate-binding protein [Mycolicibacterium sp. XJ2546]
MSGAGQNRRRALWRIATAGAAASALALSGCAGNTATDDTAAPTTTAPAQKIDKIANTVPEAIKSSGELVIGVKIPYPPNEFRDLSGKIVGFDVDLMNAIAATLGVAPDYRESDFAKIIPSVQGGTYNVGMSSITDTKEREESVDFVTYFSAGILWAQRPGEPVDPNNACGMKVAVQATTIQQVEELPAKSRTCTDAGRPPIGIVSFDGQDAATDALIRGEVDAMSADSPVTSYAIKQRNGKIEAAGEMFDSAPYGWPVQKGSPLAQSLQMALQHLIDTGTYEEIARNWGVESGMIDKPVINGATN